MREQARRRRASPNDEYFDVRIFDDDDDEVPAGTDGEIVVPAQAART